MSLPAKVSSVSTIVMIFLTGRNLLRKATAGSVKFVPNRQARSPRDDIVLDLARFLPPFLVEDKNNLQNTKVVRPGKAAWSES